MAHEEVSAPLRILLVEDSEHDALAFRRAFQKVSIPCHILCTGYSSSIDADKARGQGIEAFLMKPLSIDTLAPTIQRLLARREASLS